MRNILVCTAAVAALGLGCSSNTASITCPAGSPNRCGSGATLACVNFASDNANCGACGTVCGDNTRCTNGACVGCPGGLTSCTETAGVACVDTARDVDNCGACGNKCAQGQLCTGGHCGCPTSAPNACASAADAGTGATACTSFATDPNNCGACNTKCGAGTVCSSGSCVAACAAGSTSCPAAAPTYCANTKTDPNNCGSCGQTCSPGASCVNGACACQYKQVALGTFPGCAVKADGTVSCWGTYNRAGSSALFTGRNSPSQTFGTAIPAPVPGLTGVIKVAGGASLICALKRDGTVWCWGSNGVGQLGINEPPNGPAQVLPQQVQLLGTELADGGVALADGGGALDDGGQTGPGFLTSAIDISTKFGHACAVTSAGAVYCWGANGSKQLGDGTTVERDGATLVLTPAGVAFKSVAAGGAHTCAIAANGDVYCWGGNDVGQSGLSPSVAAAPNAIPDVPAGITTPPPNTAVPPTKVAGIANAVQLSLGQDFSCAVLADGTVRCWGNDSRGDLGDNRDAGSASFAPVAVLGSTDGGPATLDDGGTSFLPLGGIAEVAAGQFFALARATDGGLYAWGANNQGELGLTTPDGGGTIASNVALPVSNFSNGVSIAGNHRSSCAVRADGTLWCWGIGKMSQTAGVAAGGVFVFKPQQVPTCY